MSFDLNFNTLQFSTSQLELRSTVLEDAGNVHDMFQDSKTMTYIPFITKEAFDVAAVRSKLQLRMEEAENKNCCHFTMFEKTSSAFLGICFLIRINRRFSNAEFGMMIHHPFWGKGYAEHAIKLCLDFAFNKLKMTRIEANTSVENIPAQKFFEKVGFIYEGTRRNYFPPHQPFLHAKMYSMLDHEWPMKYR